MPYDLLIKGGHVLDPGQGLDGHMDIAASGGKIAAIEDIDRKAIASCIQANPGLVGGFKLLLVGPVVHERADDVVRLSILTHLCTPNPGGDTTNKEFTGTQALVPVQTVRAGELFAPEWGPYPWGWLPESA